MIANAIYAKLATLGYPVYPHSTPPTQRPAYPLIVYSISGAVNVGPSLIRHSVDFAIIAETYATALSIASSVRSMLHLHKGTWGGQIVTIAIHEKESESVKEVTGSQLWVVEQSYRITVPST